MIPEVLDHWQQKGFPLDLMIAPHPRAKRLKLQFDQRRQNFKLTTPVRIKPAKILDFLKDCEGWIKRQLAQRIERPAVPQDIILFGQTLQLTFANRTTTHIWADEKTLFIYGPEERHLESLKKWLKQQAKSYFHHNATLFAEQLNVTFQKISIRDSTTRWGSCSSSGNLSFSWRLILAPLEVSQYVCAHEVAHLKELNHSHRFWQLVNTLHPNHKQCRLWLRKNTPSLFAF